MKPEHLLLALWQKRFSERFSTTLKRETLKSVVTNMHFTKIPKMSREKGNSSVDLTHKNNN